MQDTLVAQANASISTWQNSYYTFAIIFYALCVAMIVLPLIIASDILPTKWNRIVALVSAAVAAAVNWANLGVIAGNFDKGRDDLRTALLRYDTDKDRDKLLKAYEQAQALVRSSSPGVPQTSTTKQ